jgi:hypothetical protein
MDSNRELLSVKVTIRSVDNECDLPIQVWNSSVQLILQTEAKKCKKLIQA